MPKFLLKHVIPSMPNSSMGTMGYAVLSGSVSNGLRLFGHKGYNPECSVDFHRSWITAPPNPSSGLKRGRLR